jgi:hypothetical protein
MKKLLILLLLLSGCSTSVPVTRNFTNLPPSLEKPCDSLQEVKPTDKLSDVLLVVTDNYSLYHECRIKVETWQDWYKKNKEIFESVK